MEWSALGAYAVGGAVLANALPHLISGLLGRPFPTPFATPPGQGLSSATTNVLWGFAKLVIAYVLVLRVGHFDIRDLADMLALGGGGLVLAVLMSRHFGRLQGGNTP